MNNETTFASIIAAAESQQSVDLCDNETNFDIGDLDNNITVEYDVLNGYADQDFDAADYQ